MSTRTKKATYGRAIMGDRGDKMVRGIKIVDETKRARLI